MAPAASSRSKILPSVESRREPDIRCVRGDTGPKGGETDLRCGCQIKSHFEAKQTSSLVTFAGFLRVLRYVEADYTLRLSAQIENEVIEWAILKSKMRVFELRI